VEEEDPCLVEEEGPCLVEEEDQVEVEDLPFQAMEEEGEDLPCQVEAVVEVDPPFQEEEVEGVVDLQTCLVEVEVVEGHQRVLVVEVEGVGQGVQQDAMKPPQLLQFLGKSSV